ncbi:MAG: hypothetical protein M1826_003270 [Phylliscum demangeonii]|nr:MAG: hypothetical protein M1826_003270 [Phylliscum demangeonii]
MSLLYVPVPVPVPVSARIDTSSASIGCGDEPTALDVPAGGLRVALDSIESNGLRAPPRSGAEWARLNARMERQTLP